MRERAKRKSLTQELEDLERSDPAVAEAARRYDETVDRILHRTRIERFKAHRAGECDPASCLYVH